MVKRNMTVAQFLKEKNRRRESCKTLNMHNKKVGMSRRKQRSLQRAAAAAPAAVPQHPPVLVFIIYQKINFPNFARV